MSNNAEGPEALLTPWCLGDAQRENAREPRPNTSPCCVCGKGVNLARPYVTAVVVNGNLDWGDERSDPQDPGYMGYYPVGPDCARRLRRQGVPLYKGEVRS